LKHQSSLLEINLPAARHPVAAEVWVAGQAVVEWAAGLAADAVGLQVADWEAVPVAAEVNPQVPQINLQVHLP
jgi:hypothetical protein